MGRGLWQCVPALLPREGTWAGCHHRAVLQGQHRVAVPTGSWAGSSAELRVSVQSSSFTRQRVREHGPGPEGPAPELGCGTTGGLESHHCLPHTGTHISHPRLKGARAGASPFLVSVSLSEEAVPACWASQLPGDQLGWSTAGG